VTLALPPYSTSNLTRLRARLADAGYSEAPVRELLGVSAPAPLPPVGHPSSLVRTAASDAGLAGLVTRLLLLGETISGDETAALPKGLVADLADAGLVASSPAGLRPLVRLTPFHDLLLAGDHHNEESVDVAAEAVENPHGPTEILARLIPRQSVGRSLDIGSGSGVHALELARHSAAVTGVDVSARAVAFAQFNAALNGITNVRFKTGDVAGGLEQQSFDLIVSNPPYLVSPESGIVYRDGNAGSGHIGTRVLAEAPALLCPDGLLVCLTSWGVADPDDPDRKIRSIAESVRCNALVLVYAARTPLDNAVRWNAHRRDARDLRQAVQRWLDYYQRHQLKQIAYGIVVFSPSNGRTPWFRSKRVTVAGQDYDRGQLRDIITALDRCAHSEIPDHLHPHPDHVIESVARIGGGTTIVSEQTLRSTRGLPFTVSCGPRLVGALAHGSRPLPDGHGSEVMVTMLRNLYELGLVVGHDAHDGDPDECRPV